MFKKMLQFILNSEDNQRKAQVIKRQIKKECDKTMEKVKKTNNMIIKKTTTYYLAKASGIIK